jgi:excisionase family DNA binding protein
MIMEQSTGAGSGPVRWAEEPARTIRLYTVKELAEEVFNLSEAKIWELVRTGRIESFKIDSSRRITQDAVEKFIASLVAEEADRRAGSAA